MFKDKSKTQNCTCALIMTVKILMSRNRKGQQRNIKEVFCFMRFCISSLFVYSKKKKKRIQRGTLAPAKET